MYGAVASFVTLSINPFGGMMLSIPFAVFHLRWPAWAAWAAGVPLSYVQVIVVNAFWTQLTRLRWWRAFLERRRSARVERLVASRGAFWLTTLLSPIIGPWLVMSFMRYANVPHRTVALPLFLGLMWNGGAIALACAWLPHLFRH